MQQAASDRGRRGLLPIVHDAAKFVAIRSRKTKVHQEGHGSCGNCAHSKEHNPNVKNNVQTFAPRTGLTAGWQGPHDASPCCHVCQLMMLLCCFMGIFFVSCRAHLNRKQRISHMGPSLHYYALWNKKTHAAVKRWTYPCTQPPQGSRRFLRSLRPHETFPLGEERGTPLAEAQSRDSQRSFLSKSLVAARAVRS
jgi:hypothetical protein